MFSFGIVMWEILTGEEPYANMHYGAIIGAHHHTLVCLVLFLVSGIQLLIRDKWCRGHCEQHIEASCAGKLRS